jgi:hypothetical protein
MENEIPPYERSIGIQTNQQVSGSSSCQLAGRLRRLFENAHDGIVLAEVLNLPWMIWLVVVIWRMQDSEVLSSGR